MLINPIEGFGGVMFRLVPVLVAIVFIIILGILISRAIQAGKQWKRNNESPVLTVDAVVKSKRMDVCYHQNANLNQPGQMGYSRTFYYVTFEVESGDRMEFSVNGTEYGVLAQDDTGKLTFQGTRYLGFDRKRTL